MRNSTIGTFLMFIALAFLSNFSTAYAQSCNSELRVVNNRDARSASENDPTQFQMEILNNSSSSQSYDIRVANFEGIFIFKSEEPLRLNSIHDLNVLIYQNNSQNPMIIVPARSTANFQVSVSVPIGTPVNQWGGLEVKAISDTCPDGAISALLKLFVTDPNEE
jgi:hypothetical protein